MAVYSITVPKSNPNLRKGYLSIILTRVHNGHLPWSMYKCVVLYCT